MLRLPDARDELLALAMVLINRDGSETDRMETDDSETGRKPCFVYQTPRGFLAGAVKSHCDLRRERS